MNGRTKLAAAAIGFGLVIGPAGAQGKPPFAPDSEYCARRDADPQKCMIQDGPPNPNIIRKPPPPPPPKSKSEGKRLVPSGPEGEVNRRKAEVKPDR